MKTSRLTEIRNQYQGYIAAREAVEKTNPGTVKVVYKEDDPEAQYPEGIDGFFIYDPRENKITIHPKSCSIDCVKIDADDVPALIKALREFFE
jgi:hypothetical protein